MIYLVLAAIILFTIGLLKGLFILGGFDALQMNDPVLSFLTNKDTMFLSVLFEYAVVGIIIFKSSIVSKLFSVLMLGVIFLWYNIGLSVFAVSSGCKCVGTLAQAYIEETPIRYILNGILSYILIGSSILLYSDVKKNRINPDAKNIKVTGVLLLLILAGFCSNGEEKIQAFSITGELQATFNRVDGSSINENVPFRIILAGSNQWNICYYINYIKATNIIEYVCNGENVYKVRSSNSIETIRPGCIPYDSYKDKLPWFAYASGEYLKTNQSIPAIWYGSYAEPEAHIYDMEVKLTTVPPYVPESSKWIVSSNKVEINNLKKEFDKWPVAPGLSHHSFSRRDWLSSYRVLPEPIGFEAARYKILSFTNYNGYQFPLVYTLECYRYTTNNTIPKNKIIIKGTTQYIEVVSNYNIYPNLPKYEIDKGQMVPDIKKNNNILFILGFLVVIGVFLFVWKMIKLK